MVKVTGHVDDLGRPVVSVVAAATGDPFLATVDTGFNGELMMTLADAASVGARLNEGRENAELGDGRIMHLRKGRLAIQWLGERREADIFVSEQMPRGGEDRPIALIGTALLTPHLLRIDFATGTVEIEARE